MSAPTSQAESGPPKVVVGYTTTHSGADAVALGVRLARATGADVELVMALPARTAQLPIDSGYEAYLREQARSWLAAAAASVPDDVACTTRTIQGESTSQALREASTGAAMMVVGAADGSRRGRFGIGSVTGELLHSAEVPLALAPADSATVQVAPSRITVGVGTRAGADEVLRRAVALATAAQLPIRLVSLVAFDLPPDVESRIRELASIALAQEALTSLREMLPDHLDAEATTVEGTTIQAAVNQLDWQPGDVALVGSSRLAAPRRLFLSSTAARMLRELPVPMIVVPRASEMGQS